MSQLGFRILVESVEPFEFPSVGCYFNQLNQVKQLSLGNLQTQLFQTDSIDYLFSQQGTPADLADSTVSSDSAGSNQWNQSSLGKLANSTESTGFVFHQLNQLNQFGLRNLASSTDSTDSLFANRETQVI